MSTPTDAEVLDYFKAGRYTDLVTMGRDLRCVPGTITKTLLRLESMGLLIYTRRGRGVPASVRLVDDLRKPEAAMRKDALCREAREALDVAYGLIKRLEKELQR